MTRAAGLLLCACVAASGCGAVAGGDFDGVPFAPTATSFAVLDRHDFLVSDGSVQAVRRSDAGMKLHLFLTGASLEPEEHWASLPAARVLDTKHRLSTTDGLVITDVPLARALAGESLEIELSDEGATGTGAFDAALVVGTDSAEALGPRGFGDLVSVRLELESIDAPARGGFVIGRLEVKRARAPGQSGELATGEVTIDLRLPAVPERLGEANLALARPVMACAAQRGPDRAGGCRDVEADPYVDETGVVEIR